MTEKQMTADKIQCEICKTFVKRPAKGVRFVCAKQQRNGDTPCGVVALNTSHSVLVMFCLLWFLLVLCSVGVFVELFDGPTACGCKAPEKQT